MHVVILAPGAVGRVPVRAFADALRAHGVDVGLADADSDAEIDTVLHGITTTDGASPSTVEKRLVIAGSDGVVRAVVRRMVRQALAQPRHRPTDLPPNRTIGDLPAIGLLPLPADGPSLTSALSLPTTAQQLADAMLSGATQRLDLLRNDAGSVTLHGALLGGANEHGRSVPWRGTINVDDAVLTDGTDHVLACAIGNAAGYASIAGLPLLDVVDASDGQLQVGIAIARQQTVEVRRARGRAVTVHAHAASDTNSAELPFTDDGVDGVLRRRKTWWVEPGAWAVFTTAQARPNGPIFPKDDVPGHGWV